MSWELFRIMKDWWKIFRVKPFRTFVFEIKIFHLDTVTKLLDIVTQFPHVINLKQHTELLLLSL